MKLKFFGSPPSSLHEKAKFNRATASLFSFVAASFGVLVILRSFAATPPPNTVLPTNHPPTATVTGASAATAGQPTVYTASASDVDGNLNKIEIYSAIHTVQDFTLLKTCDFAATSTGSCSISWTPTSGGAYDIVVNAYDAAGAKCSGNPGVTYPYYGWTNCDSNAYLTVTVASPAATPPPPPPTSATPKDTIAPTVSISSPANGAKIGNGTYISASSSDNVGVKKMEVYIDGVIKASSVTNSIAYTWTSYYAAAGSHLIAIKAYDAAGNVGQASVSVTH